MKERPHTFFRSQLTLTRLRRQTHIGSIVQGIAGVVWTCPLAQYHLAGPAKEFRVHVGICCLTTLFWQQRPFALLGDKSVLRLQWVSGTRAVMDF